jgi:hypothetical protein
MPNKIKYSVSGQSLALRDGNFWIGTGDVAKGPTSTTGYWNGITPTPGGYTIYLNKASNGPSIYVASDDAKLIDLTNKIAGTSYTTVNECFNYYAAQSDKMVFNRDYSGVVTNGLVLCLSGSFIPSYPRNNSVWYDLTGNVNGSLTNGATYSTDGMGCISFDGVDDLVSLSDGVNTRFSNTSPWSIQLTFKINSFVNTYPGIIIKGNSASGYGILIFYMSNGVLYWKHNNSGGLLSSSVTANSMINIAITYSGSGNVMGYFNGVYAGSLSTMNGTESSSTLYLGLGDQYGNQNLYEFYKYDRQLSSTEVLQNFRSADPKMFSACKTAKEILDMYPQLAGYDGLYWVYPGGPNSTPYQVYCDMTTDGGGWMLISRSHPTTINYGGENWGWKGGTIGSVNDFSQAYQLGWGEIWDGNATFTSFIFGNQRTNGDNSWGPFIYRVSSINYSTFFGSDSLQGYTNSVLKSNTSVYGADWYPGMQTYTGFTTTGTNNNIYFMRDCCGFAGYGGTPTGMSTVYCGANFYYSGAWCGGSTTTGSVYDYNTYISNGLTFGGTNQYMIMVR